MFLSAFLAAAVAQAPPADPSQPPPPSASIVSQLVNCTAAPNALESALRGVTTGSVIHVDPVTPCLLGSQVVVDRVDGLEMACWDSSTGQGCADGTMATVQTTSAIEVGLVFKSCAHFLARGISFVDFGVKHQAATGGTTVDNSTYDSCDFTDAPGTALVRSSALEPQ